MLKSQKETEELIRKLLEEGHTYREITPIARCSPNLVAKVQRKITGERNESNMLIRNRSLCAQVFDCLLKKMPLTQIDKDLDVEPEKVKNFHKEFLLLQNQDNLVKILDKDKAYHDELLKLRDYLTLNNLDMNKYTTRLIRKKN